MAEYILTAVGSFCKVLNATMTNMTGNHRIRGVSAVENVVGGAVKGDLDWDFDNVWTAVVSRVMGLMKLLAVGMFVTMEEGYLQHCAAAIIALMIHREVAVITVSTRMWYNLAQNKHYNK